MQVDNETKTIDQQEQKPVDDLQERLDSLDKPQEEASTQSNDVQPESGEKLPSLDELDLPTEQPQSTSTKEVPVQESAGLPETPEAKKFAEDFKQYLGFDISELRGGIQELEQYRQQIALEKQQQAQEKQLGSLQQEWGLDKAEFDGRMNQIIDRFQKYSPEMQQRLDTLEGAKLIWAKIEQEMKDSNSVPQFQKSSFNGSGGKKFLFSASEIKAMNKSEYSKNADKILKAYQLGLVDNSR